MDCRYSQQIAPYLMDDLPASQRREVSLHLDRCRPCRREKAALEETFGALGNVEDVPVPHHFFLPRNEPRLGVVQAWARLSGLWKTGVAAALVLLLTVAGLAASGFQMEMNQGVLRAGFGPFPPQSPAISEERLQAWSDQVLAQVQSGLASRDEALAAMVSQIGLLDQRLQGADAVQQRRLRTLVSDLEKELSLAWRRDDQEGLQRMEQWVSQAYADLRLDYLRRLSVMDSNLEQFAQRDSALNQQVSLLGEALAYTLDQRQPRNTGE